MIRGGTIRRRPAAGSSILAAALAVLLAAPVVGGELGTAFITGVSARRPSQAAAIPAKSLSVAAWEGRHAGVLTVDFRTAGQASRATQWDSAHTAPPEAGTGGSTEAGRRLYSLPEDYRGPLGTFNQAALLAHQKKRLGEINTGLNTRLRMSETRHYLVFSDADSATTTRFRTWSEALYESLLKQFGLSERTRVWDGKCVLILFKRRRAFERYAKTFDGHDARSAGAYFAVEDHGPGLPHLVHICFPLDTTDPRRQQELLAHEGTHAFFELYKTPGRLPLWLHEGLAEYMTTVNDRALGPPKRLRATGVAAAGKPIAPLFDAKPGQGLSLEEYSVALTLVDFLLAEGRPTFKAFVDTLKDGKEQAAALQKAYGFDFAELERRWRAHVRRTPPGR